MRRAGIRVGVRRWNLLCAGALVVLGGCAQIAGIEPWRAAHGCDDPGLDPDTCEPLPTCTECLYSSPKVCEAARTDCTTDPMSLCSTLDTCAEGCEMNADPVACIHACCTTSGADVKFDAYLTCLCNECKDECGAQVMGCDAFCG